MHGMRKGQDRSAAGLALLALLATGAMSPRGVAQAPATPSNPSAPAPKNPAKATAPPQGHAVVSATGKDASTPAGDSNALPPGPGVLVDQVIAVVNGDLILESDVDENRRLQAFQPFGSPNDRFLREDVVERLIDRALILQQAKLQPDSAVSDAELQAQLQALRKEIPACKQYHCETDAGWAKFVNDQGFTLPQFEQSWRQRMQVLKFIEIRFRSGIDITPAQIKDYYDTKLLPEYARRNAPAPKLAAISDRIQEILLQQQVSSLLADWLKSLKAQGNVRVMAPGEGL